MPATRRSPTLGSLAAAAVIAGVLAVGAGAGAADGDRVLVFGRWGTFTATARNQTVSHLRNLGHDVTVSDALPADLTGFDAVWVVTLQPLTGAEAGTLVGYVRGGGGLHLAGEAAFSSMWTTLNASLQPVVDGVLGAGVTVDGTSVSGPYAFNPAAAGDVAVGLTTLPGVTSSVGRLDGVTGPNVLLTTPAGTPVGGVWDASTVPGGGRLTVVVDLTWMALTTSATASVMDRLQEFLGGSNSPPVVSVGDAPPATEGGSVTVAGAAEDPDGDALVLEWTATAGADVDGGGSCTFGSAAAVETTVTCTDDGTYTLTLSASDGFNPPVTASTTLAVANVAPHVSVASPASGAAVAVGAPLDVLATVVDPGGDPVSCAFDWGDGTGSAEPAAAGVCGAAHAYAEAGMRTVTVTAADDDGGTSSASFSVAVFDPAGGWVTGGGRVGDGGSFSLSARYGPDGARPAGHFRWSATRDGPAFVASAFDWMIVGGDGVVVLEGSGSMDGTGGHRFRLTGTPGRGANDATLELEMWPGVGSTAAQMAGGGASPVRGALTVHR